jgi:hypothetical protein
MTMQFDVKSQHASTSGLMVAYRTRLKGAVVFPFTAATGYSTFVDDTSIAGTYARTTTTATITSANHGLATGQWVYLDWDLTDNPYQVTVTGTDTFTVTVANSRRSKRKRNCLDKCAFASRCVKCYGVHDCCSRGRYFGA